MRYPVDFTEDLRKKPICGVIAVAIAGDKTFKEAERAIINNMMPFQKRHGGRTYPEQVQGALREVGRVVREVPTPRMTLQRWMKDHCYLDRTYVVMVTGHYVTIKRGLIADQTHIEPIETHWARRKFVTNVWEIS